MMSSISLWCPVWKTQICDFGDFKPDQKAVSESKAAAKQLVVSPTLIYCLFYSTWHHHLQIDIML